MPVAHRNVHYRTVPSPIGELTLAGIGSTLTHLLMSEQAHSPDRGGWEPADADAFADVATQLEAYFAGGLTEFDVDMRLVGSGFQRRVWAALRHISPGETRSYSALAAEMGAPRATRAVARACAQNPVSLAVPCHRVVGKDGDITGYRWGVTRKRDLLLRESR